MKSIKGALFAGISVSIVALASNSVLYSVNIAFAKEGPPEVVQDNAPVDKMNQKTEELSEKVDTLIQESEDKIDQYQKLYDELYDTDLRLSYKHITYSSRLVSKEDNYIKNNPTVNSYREDPLYLDLRTHSAVTAYEIDEYILKGTALEGLGKAFVQAELDYGVNAMFLLSLGVHESSWGRSAIARDKNNLFGYGAYDGSPYESSIAFSTKAEGINRVAKHLAETFLTANGRYYSGGYTLQDVNKKYASDQEWAEKIAKTMDEFNKTIMQKQDTNYHEEKCVIGEDKNGEPIYSKTFKAAVE